MRSGAITSATRRNFTGQQLDETGLLFYNARYYDPTLARFISADSVVPGAAALTIWPSDATAASAWGRQANGPANPQALNRYSYVQNNPVKATDPSGHDIELSYDEANKFVTEILSKAIEDLRNTGGTQLSNVLTGALALGGAVASLATGIGAIFGLALEAGAFVGSVDWWHVNEALEFLGYMKDYLEDYLIQYSKIIENIPPVFIGMDEITYYGPCIAGSHCWDKSYNVHIRWISAHGSGRLNRDIPTSSYIAGHFDLGERTQYRSDCTFIAVVVNLGCTAPVPDNTGS